ncbi:Uncharacterized protein conserved in bacteria [Yersinia nurmii]|uniref:Uncharacterized protein conserved in bacteria n=1 Tax=Yersinia nurmii TaxID=685706 RepID=A0ABP1Y9I4_9GAMM|nr:DotU family type IV/VI secretion system protein [Yersinia nurmii]CNE27777.1 Uncharacterized protein conserved in bacteria [Yersinia nurmii]
MLGGIMKTLIDCYVDVFRFALILEKQPDFNHNYQYVREKTTEVFEIAAKAAESQGYSDSECDRALLAVMVWFDEFILSSSLSYAKQWKDILLQTQLFQTTSGGDVFFNQLEQMDKNENELRMLYLLCLRLGFHGKYNKDNGVFLNKTIANEEKSLPEYYYLKLIDISHKLMRARKKSMMKLILNRFINKKCSASIIVLLFFLGYFMG